MTLAEVAAEAGVSLATASKVLNGRADVAGGTRARVRTVLDLRNYERRGQVRGAAPLVEIVFQELNSPWSLELLAGVAAVAHAEHASVVLTPIGSRHSPGPEWIDEVLRRRPIGVVLVFWNLPGDVSSRLRAGSIPFVVVDPAGDPPQDVPSVGSANWAGGMTATQHLLAAGHRRIAIITGPVELMCSVARLAGFRSAMALAGAEVDPALVRYGDFQVAGGYSAAAELLDAADPPTAVFAGSDLQALGVIEAARERGIAVPAGLSVVGYDDVPIARWSSPALTTVHQPLTRMAEEATRLLFRLRRGDRSAVGTRVELATHLIVRGSTAAPRPRRAPSTDPEGGRQPSRTE